MFYYKSLQRKIPAVFKIIASYSRSYFVISSKIKNKQQDSMTVKRWSCLKIKQRCLIYHKVQIIPTTSLSTLYVMIKRVTELTVFLMPQYSRFDTANEWIKVTKTLSSVVWHKTKNSCMILESRAVVPNHCSAEH